MKKQLTKRRLLELFAVNSRMNQNCFLRIEKSTMTVWALPFEGLLKDGGYFTFETCLTQTYTTIGKLQLLFKIFMMEIHFSSLDHGFVFTNLDITPYQGCHQVENKVFDKV